MAPPAVLLRLHLRRRRRHRRAPLGHSERAGRDRPRSPFADCRRRARRHDTRLDAGRETAARSPPCGVRLDGAHRNARDADDGASGGWPAGGAHGGAARRAARVPAVRGGRAPGRPAVLPRARREPRHPRSAGAVDDAWHSRRRSSDDRPGGLHRSRRPLHWGEPITQLRKRKVAIQLIADDVQIMRKEKVS